MASVTIHRQHEAEQCLSEKAKQGGQTLETCLGATGGATTLKHQGGFDENGNGNISEWTIGIDLTGGLAGRYTGCSKAANLLSAATAELAVTTALGCRPVSGADQQRRPSGGDA